MRILIFSCFALGLVTKGVTGLFDSCIHGGTRYEEGDHFVPNDTLIKTENPQQCVQCKCRRGLVLCEIENCPPSDCKAPVQIPQFCCLQCPVSRKRATTSLHRPFSPKSHIPPNPCRTDSDLDFLVIPPSGKFQQRRLNTLQGVVSKKKDSSDLVFGKASLENSKSDCFSNGLHRKTGSVWQPVIGPFGVMACVQCRCQEGNIICGRLECEAVRCTQPRRELGHCCPVCSSSEKSKKKAFCLPKSSELFVFKTPNVRNNSEKIEYAFLENKWKHDVAKIHTWNLRPKSLADFFVFSVISRKEFHRRNFQILGSVTKKGLKKYSKREKRIRSTCLRQCLRKITRLESSLVDFTVKSRTKCNEDEVDVAGI